MKDKEKDIIDFGQWNVPSSWSEVTLKKFQDIQNYYDGISGETKFDIREVLHILCDKTVDEVNALPSEFLDMILEKLAFIQTQPEQQEPTNKIKINGETYLIHFENQLKTGEYIAADTVLKNDKNNIALLLAILCRKDGEVYDSKFENEVVPEREKMFEQQPVINILPIAAFFFNIVRTFSDAFPVVFKGGGSNKPHSQQYRDFGQGWGFQKIIYEMADNSITKVAEINQQYIQDTLVFLTYLIQKGEMEEAEDKFQETLRKAKRGGK